MQNEKTISFEKASRIKKIQVNAIKICELTEDKIRTVGGWLEPEDINFTLTLVVPKIFDFETNVAEMMTELWGASDSVFMTAIKDAIRMTFVVRDVYQK